MGLVAHAEGWCVMDTWNELRIRTQIGRLTAEQYGMDAENQQRIHTGQLPAYGSAEFERMQDQWAALEEQIRNLG